MDPASRGINEDLPTTEKGSVSTSYVRALLRTVSDNGHDAAAFAAEEGLDVSSLDSVAGIPAFVFGRLCQRAIWLLKDESLGMVTGGKVANGTFRMMCLCIIHCPTLEMIIQRGGEFLDVCNGGAVKPQVIYDSQSVSVGIATVRDKSHFSLEGILQEAGPVKVRTSLYLWHNLLSWFAGKSLPLKSVEFPFSEPANGKLWSQVFRCSVKFDCPAALLRFEPELLQLPNVQNEKTLAVFLKSAPYRLIVPAHDEHKMSDKVLAIFGDDLSIKLPSSTQVGKQLGVSVSTLRRQLLAEGTSFQSLKDECRRATAVRYLASTDLTFSEISQLLGFDETSAFYRSFRRWTGITPTQYRERL